MTRTTFARSTRMAAFILAGSAVAAVGGPATEATPRAVAEATARPAARALDEAAIRATVQNYFDGMMEGSAEKLAEAFDANAVLIGTAEDGTALQRIPFAPWAEHWDGRELDNPAAYRNRITHVDFTGDAAVARTVLEWPSVRYVDYLSLLRVDGEWKIVNKIWTEE